MALTEHKAAVVAAMRAALADLCPVLRCRASELGGRYVLFGSAARDELRYSSDIDLLLDFPDEASTREAWTFAEEECARRDLEYDIRPIQMCDAKFLAHIRPEAVSLP